MRNLIKRIACLGLVAGALGGGAMIVEKAAYACYVPVPHADAQCTCRGNQSNGYTQCGVGSFLSCSVQGDCGNGGGSGGDGRPL